MFNKHKDRLYLFLERKNDVPGYLWSIVLAPADEKQDGKDADSIQWHVVEETPRNWFFYKDQLNMHQARRAVVRILVAKFTADDQDVRARVDTLLREVPVERDDPDFRTRIWAMNGMENLFHAGIARYNMTKAELETLAMTFANETMLQLTRRELTITKPSDIPTRDLRW